MVFVWDGTLPVLPFFPASGFLKRGVGQKAQKAQPLEGTLPSLLCQLRPWEGHGSRAGAGCQPPEVAHPGGQEGAAALAGTRYSPSGRLEGVQGGRGMHREGFIPAACAFSKEIYWKCHPRLPGQTFFSFLRAA